MSQCSAFLQVRLAGQAVVAGQHLWLIGGWDPGFRKDGGEILSDVWRLDLQTWEWEEMQPRASCGAPYLLDLAPTVCLLLPSRHRLRRPVVGSSMAVTTSNSMKGEQPHWPLSCSRIAIVDPVSAG